jgi:hypothetical protein
VTGQSSAREKVEGFSPEWLKSRSKDDGLSVERFWGEQVEAFPSLGANGGEVTPETCT